MARAKKSEGKVIEPKAAQVSARAEESTPERPPAACQKRLSLKFLILLFSRRVFLRSKRGSFRSTRNLCTARLNRRLGVREFLQNDFRQGDRRQWRHC